MSLVPAELLLKLACPRCRGPLVERAEETALACDACRVLYDIVDGIPGLVPDLARPQGDATR